MPLEYLLRAVLRSLVLPPGGPLLLIVAGLVSLRRWRRAALLMLWLGATSLWLFSAPFFANRLERAVETVPALDLSTATGAQAIVILSANSYWAQEYGGDAADGDTLRRLAYGAYVARRTGLPILVTGGTFNDRPALAFLMRDSLRRDFATPVRWLEPRSRDTHENALYSAAMLGAAQVHHIILVTSAEHMPRAVAEFTATGLRVTPAPQGFVGIGQQGILSLVPDAATLQRSQRCVYELLGDVVRRLRGVR
jgi:uncharacterized SAM-binding protein YcdF (DUF218 family)